MERKRPNRTQSRQESDTLKGFTGNTPPPPHPKEQWVGRGAGAALQTIWWTLTSDPLPQPGEWTLSGMAAMFRLSFRFAIAPLHPLLLNSFVSGIVHVSHV